MTDPDRLAEITEHLTDHQDIHEDDGWWLLGEVERLRKLLAQRDRLLARLEWADRDEYERGFCPVCGSAEATGDGHDPGCELAAALHPERERTP